MSWKKTFSTLICLSSSSLIYANTPVATSTDLQNAIVAANSGGDNTITLTAPIDLTVAFGAPNLRPINTTDAFAPIPANSVTIFGGGASTPINGGGAHRGFLVRGGTVTLNGINFFQTASFGGAGGNTSGGGGAGIGGALIVDTGANVIATNCTFQSSSATGGNGGVGDAAPGAGGGGGMGGSGGIGAKPNYAAGGGGALDFSGGTAFNPADGIPLNLYSGAGGGGVGAAGQDSNQGTNPGAGAGGNNWAGANGGSAGTPFGGNGGSGGGGGGGAYSNSNSGGNGGSGGGGGGGGAGNAPNPVGNGGEYGGGGGAGNEGNPGGAGGFAGGGGGGGVISGTRGVLSPGGTGGAGGFGGGGGGGAGAVNTNPGITTPGVGGIGGFGGGTGGNGGSAPSFNFDTPAWSGGGGGGAGFGGAIFIRDGGTLTLSGSATFANNTVTGGAGGAITGTIPAGYTSGTPGGNGAAAGADIFMMAGANLIVDNTTNINIPNPIAGDQGAGGGTGGGLTKLGCARLTLNGANTFTGTTNVNAGELRIDGSVLTDINVSAGAIISGNFSTTGSIDNAGIITPGDGGVGTISMTGSFTNQATGIVQVDITPTSGVNDFIIQGTGATLSPGSTLDIVVNAGNYIAGTQYTVINSPVTGTFGTNIFQTGVNANLIDIGVTYTNGVILTILQNFIFQNQTINPGIPSAVSRCIQVADIVPESDFANIIQQLGLLSSSDLNRALYNMSPVNYGALDWINARNNNYIADIIDEHLFKLCCDPRDCCPCGTNMSVWLDVFGNLMYNTKHYGHMSRFNAEAVGVITGLDYCFCENYTLGAAFAYSHTWLDWKKHHGHGNIDSYYGALYGSYQGCCIDIDLSVIGGGSNHHLHRKIDIEGSGVITTLNTNLCAGTTGVITTPVVVDIKRTAKGNPWGYFFTGHLGISTDWDWCCTNFEPYALIDYNYFHREEFREHGAGDLNLSVREHIQNMLRGEVGIRAYHTWDCDCFCFAPYLGLSWVGEFPLSHSKQKGHFVGHSCTFSVDSYHSAIQLASPEAGIKFTSPCGFSMWVGYKGLYNSSTNINQVDAGIEWVF